MYETSLIVFKKSSEINLNFVKPLNPLKPIKLMLEPY